MSDEWDRACFPEEVTLTLEGKGRIREKNIPEVMTLSAESSKKVGE